MITALVQLLTAFISSFGFSMLFGMRRRYLVFGGLGGLLTWGVYLLARWGLSFTPFNGNEMHIEFFACLLAAAFAIIYAELLARMLKTPATLFVVPAILPLVPGGSLYYTMSSAVHGDAAGTKYYGTLTAIIALALAAGISFVMAIRAMRTKKH